MPTLAALTVLLSLICLVFYVGLRPEHDRNYGGVCSGFRWMIWLIPLWTLGMIPMADAMSSGRTWRGIAVLLLACSVFSAVYPWSNPWSHPWLFQYWEHLGWIHYP